MKKIQLNASPPRDETHSFSKRDVPQLHVNIHGLDGLENKLKSIKLGNYQSEFLEEIKKVLSLYEEDELKYNYQFVEFVMQEVERFILKKKSGQAKKDLVIEICKKYFNDDAKLVEMVIELVFHKLPQIKFFKRQGLKLIRYFLKVKPNRQLAK